jgi:hypothetical protein
MKHVFISYSRSDVDLVELIEMDLLEDGHIIWRDTENIRGGEDWGTKIEEGIVEAYAFIVVLSPASLKSEWVNKEIDFAVKNVSKTPIIPLILEDIEIPNPIKKLQIIDFSKMQEADGTLQIKAYRSARKRLLDAIEVFLPVLKYIKMLQDSDQDLREKAALELGKLADPISTDYLITALSDVDQDVVFEATRALGKMKSKTAFKHLIRLLDSDDPDLCASTADALGNIGIKHSALLNLLAHKDRFVRESAVRSLGKLREAMAVEPLIDLMRNDSISDVRIAATEALELIGGDVAKKAIDRMQRW